MRDGINNFKLLPGVVADDVAFVLAQIPEVEDKIALAEQRRLMAGGKPLRITPP